MSFPLFRDHASKRVYQYALKHKNITAGFTNPPHLKVKLAITSTESKSELL